MAVPQEKLWFTYTPEEYLEFEREAKERSEFYDGYIIKMSGESLAHSRVCMNLAGFLHSRLRGTPCEALSPNMKVATRTRSLFAYPDLTVVCGEPLFHDEKKDVLINPRVIFEVLSPSTEKFDRATKFQRYREENETLTDYILVSQEQVLVEHFWRGENDNWFYRRYNRLKQSLVLESIECELALNEVYERVNAPEIEDSENE